MLVSHLFHGSCLGQGMAARACPQAARGTGAAPALGVSLWLSQGQAGMWVRLSKAVAGQGCGELALLMAPGAHGGHGDGPVAQALKFGFLGWLAWAEPVLGYIFIGAFGTGCFLKLLGANKGSLSLKGGLQVWVADCITGLWVMLKCVSSVSV